MTFDIVKALSPADAEPGIFDATVVDVGADGTVDVDLGGGRVIPGCQVLGSYSPTTGDVVKLIRASPGSWLVLGPVLSSAPTTVPVVGSVAMAWNVTAAPAPPGGGTSGSTTVPTLATKSYRAMFGDGWARNEVYQGAYSGSGFWRGCYFYGAGFASLRGVTCDAISIHIARSGGGGIAGGERQWIAPHVHASQPGSSPVFVAASYNAGSLAWNASDDLTLPVSWGQKVCDGVWKGFGHLYSGTSDYSIAESLASDGTSGDVTIDWHT